jgi:ATP-dependent metalloprotease
MSSYLNAFSRKLEQLEKESNRYDTEDKHAALLKELNRVDPEGVIRWFESQSLSNHSPGTIAEYVKALVKVDRLDESALFKTLQQGKGVPIFFSLRTCSLHTSTDSVLTSLQVRI